MRKVLTILTTTILIPPLTEATFMVLDVNQQIIKGVACAGLAAARDEGTCGVGVAFRAHISGIRLLALNGSALPYTLIADALTYRNDINHIYSNSWWFPACLDGICEPDEVPPVIREALEAGVTNGRDGKGSIFVFSAGDEREEYEWSTFSFPNSSPFVINVGSIDSTGVYTWYSTPGPNLWVVAPTSGEDENLFITTSYGMDSCTSEFGGNSASTPLVAGGIALMLSVNPDLTWRDVKHILAITAVQVDAEDPGWQWNGAGYFVSHDYGFGAMDVEAAVAMAEDYTDYRLCFTTASFEEQDIFEEIPDGDSEIGVTFNITVPAMSEVEEIEFVGVFADMYHLHPEEVKIVLISPDGTESILLPGNTLEWAYEHVWPEHELTTSMHYGESPEGVWSLRVFDMTPGEEGELWAWGITFYGSCRRTDPTDTTEEATTGESTTAVSTTGEETTEVATTGEATTGVQTTGVETTGVETTGVATTGVETTGVDTTGVETTGVETTGVETTGVQTTGVETTGDETTGVATTGVQTTGVGTSGEATTGVASTGEATTGSTTVTGIEPTTDKTLPPITTTAASEDTGRVSAAEKLISAVGLVSLCICLSVVAL